MKIRFPGAFGVLAVATMGAGCASPVYQPPEPYSANEHCPVGEVVMCMGGFATRLENQPPPVCMCQPASNVQR